MKQKWTPAPWRAEMQPDVAPAKVYGPAREDGSDYAPLFTTYDHANAKLIAKAPEMAEALTALLLINENHPRYKQESENALRILREVGAL